MQERFTPFTRADLDARQQKVFDDIASGPRGTVPWIFHLYLNSPELASRVQQLGAFCRYGTSLPPHLSELAILIVAHHWKAEYEWSIHTGEARKAGLPEDIIAAIEAGRRPVFGDPDAELSVLNGTIGTHASFGKTVVTAAYSAPLTDEDRVFDGQVRLFVNRYLY